MNLSKIGRVCKIGQAEDCCRYLACGSKGFECLKNTSSQGILDKRVKENTIVAQGDNCPGDTIEIKKEV